MLKKTNLWRGLTLVSTMLLVTFNVLVTMGNKYEGFINDRFGTSAPVIQGTAEKVYQSRFGELNAENSKKLIEAENAFNVQAMEEGAVLLRNEKNALPLRENERKITFFGNNCAHPVYATNGGGASFKGERGGSLYDAFKSAGFQINDTLYNAYQNSGVARNSVGAAGASSIGEVDASFYTKELQASYANDYNDVAIVVFTRYGGEGVDLDVKDKDGVPMLSLHKSEEDLLKMIKASGKFKKTVVLVNSPFPMDIEWIEKEEYGVDACLAFGAAGDVGMIGIANLLTGKADFSGHLSDTYAASSLSAPAMRNFGNFTYSNHSVAYENNYVVYAENIYVGYKYYETRYQDQVFGVNNASGFMGTYASSRGWNYAEEVAYPFGYGLSYSAFTQEVQDISWDRNEHKVVATVKVTNEGSAFYGGKAKSVVQLYAQAPYKAGMAEKSAIQLIGFAKTSPLAKGESEVVTVEADDYLFASYDERATNGADASKTGAYVFDKGDYFFAIGDSAHDALNNVIAEKSSSVSLTDEKGKAVSGDQAKAKKVVLSETDSKTYATAPATGNTVSNALQDVNFNYYSQGAVTYLTRSDWNTYPKSYTDLSASEELKVALNGHSYVRDESVKADSFTTDAKNDIVFADLKEFSYEESEKWDKFLDQLSLDDLATISGETMGNKAIQTVNKPANNNTDGPKGLGSAYRCGDGSAITLYVDQVVMASTFNLELLAERGRLFAEDALYAGYSMIFGPGADWHRTPYSGRNSEYYSEDPNLSFLCGAAQVKTMQEGGLIAGIKHFVGNDQETNRHGVSTFATEQGFREGSLRCFEGALRDDKGGSLGTMTCFNRVGATAGAACYATQVQILRNEWGFKGVTITDSSKDASDYVHTEECIVGGTDMFNNDASRTDELVEIVDRYNDGTVLKAMRAANKHYYYAFSRSNLINGLSHDMVVKDYVPWWKIALYTAQITCIVLTVGCAGLFVTSIVLKLKEKKEGKGNV